MVRSLAVAFVLCVLAACQKNQEPPAAVAPAVEAAAGEQAPEAVVNALPEEHLKVTPALVKSYVAYRGNALSAVRAELAAFNKLSAKADKNSPADQLALATHVKEMEARIDAHTERFLKESGLSSTQYRALEKLADEIATSALLTAQSDFHATLAQMREVAKTVPPESRAEADAELARIEAGFKKLADHTDARAQWGDAAVDAVIEHIDPLKKLQADALDIFTQMNR